MMKQEYERVIKIKDEVKKRKNEVEKEVDISHKPLEARRFWRFCNLNIKLNQI